MSARLVTVTADVTLNIEAASNAPEDWLSRVTGDFPYAMYGRPFTEQEGLEHLAYNCIANGVEDASRLDGWGDLERGMLTMHVIGVEPS